MTRSTIRYPHLIVTLSTTLIVTSPSLVKALVDLQKLSDTGDPEAIPRALHHRAFIMTLMRLATGLTRCPMEWAFLWAMQIASAMR